MSERREVQGPKVKELFVETVKGLKEDKVISVDGKQKYIVCVDDDENDVRRVTLASLGELDGPYYLDDNILATAYIDTSGQLDSVLTLNNRHEALKVLSLLSQQD